MPGAWASATCVGDLNAILGHQLQPRSDTAHPLQPLMGVDQQMDFVSLIFPFTLSLFHVNGSCKKKFFF